MTCNTNSSLWRPFTDLLKQVPNHQKALPSQHLLLHGNRALQQLHQERQQSGTATHTHTHIVRTYFSNAAFYMFSVEVLLLHVCFTSLHSHIHPLFHLFLIGWCIFVCYRSLPDDI